MRKDIIELYEPFYQYTKQPSDSLEWRELRDLVDELIEKIDRPKGKWIKTTDALPSGDQDWVIAVVMEKDTGFTWLPRVMEYRKQLNDWLFQNERGWLSDEVNQGLEVVAWCPLPEPYKAKTESEE